MRLRASVVLGLILLLFTARIGGLTPAHAACTLDVTFDSVGDASYEIDDYPHTVGGAYVIDGTGGYSGNGVRTSTTGPAEGYYYSYYSIQVALDPSWEVTAFSMKVRGNLLGTDGGSGTYWKYGYGGSYTLSTVTPLVFAGGWETWNFTGLSATGYDGIGLLFAIIRDAPGSYYDVDDIVVTVDNCEEAGFQKPLTTADIDSTYGIFDTTGQSIPFLAMDEEVVVAVSNDPGDAVYNVAPGFVSWIRDPGSYNCADMELSDLFGKCYVSFQDAGDGSAIHYNSVDISAMYLVVVDIGDDISVQYLVANADQYVTEGQVLDAGCILGTTGEFFDPSIIDMDSIYIGLPSGISGIPGGVVGGVTLLALYPTIELAEPDPLVDLLTEETSPGQACNAIPEFAECMGTNPRFLNNGAGWNIRGLGGVFWQPGGGVQLNPGAEIFLQMNLNGSTAYTITAGGLNIVGGVASTLLLRLGTQSDSFTVNTTTSSVAYEDVTPSSGTGVYEVGVKVAGNGLVYLDWLCVTDGNPPQAPSACYFQNHSFDLDGTAWTFGSDIFFPQDGTAIMPDTAGGTLTQTVSLEPGDYTLSMRVRAIYVVDNVLVSPDTITSPSADIDLLYDFDSGTDTIDTFAFSGADPGWQVFTTTFTVASLTDDSMTFYIDINSGSTELAGVDIDRLCLERDGGYTPPGTGYPPLISASCEVIANPLTTDVPAWISWQWAQLRRFFTCDLMVLLNGLYQFIRTVGDTLLKAVRYFIIVVQREAAWLSNQFLPWLGGSFANIANGRLTTITQSGGECHDLFCLLDNLVTGVLSPLVTAITNVLNFVIWFLTQAASLLFNLVTSVLSLLVSILATIARLFQTLIGFLQSIVQGFNHAEPIPLPGVPQCQLDPQGNPICIALWIMENTVFADEGQLYIPLLIAVISLVLILWAVDTFRHELGSVGDKL